MSGQPTSCIHSRGPRRRPTWLWVLALAAACVALQASPAAAEVRATFVYINQDDPEIEAADNTLRELLLQKLRLDDLTPSQVNYKTAIDDLSKRDSGEPYLARVTPYVYIAAEMLGANFEILGTYVSKATSGTTYHAYFVINRGEFDSVVQTGGRQPGPEDLVRFIKARGDPESSRGPASFVYHNEFSTSSYLLPALFFRSHGIFAMPRSGGALTAIRSSKIETNSSTRLVEEVANGRADFAAVWDATEIKFEPGHEYAALGKNVYFIKLPTELPNDLLVCSRSLLLRDDRQAKAVRAQLFPPRRSGGAAPLAIGKGGIGDFREWVDINEAGTTRSALAGLRQLAAEQRTPVTVRVEEGDKRIPDEYVEAARQAVRLSGTEFVLYDRNFHGQKADFLWTLEWVREGCITLRSEIPAFGKKAEQEFAISFQPAAPGAEEQDLTQRIGNILTSRLHRIRFVWPYSGDEPRVIRDVPFSLVEGTAVEVQKIKWSDPVRNAFTVEINHRPVDLEGAADFFKFQLKKESFPQAMTDAGVFERPDPMSPVAYRVLLRRPPEPQAMFTVFNAVFFGLVGLSGAGTALAWRRARRPTGSP